jgi:hypothetical protein
MIHSDDDLTRTKAYARLWIAYRASGHAQGSHPADAARWAYTQALQFVCPATAEHIAAAVLAAGQARSQGKAEQAVNPPPNPRPAGGQQLQCANCAAVAPLKAPPAGWMRVESLHREGRRSNPPLYHNFCSTACATAWFAGQATPPAPAASPAAANAARPVPPTSRSTPPVFGARPSTPRATANAPRRAVRVVRS